MPETKHPEPPIVSIKPRPTRRNHVRYTGALLAGVGFLANVAAIAGLVISNMDVIVITAGLIAALCGVYLFLRRWGRPTGWYTLATIVLIVAGSVVFSLGLQSHHLSERSDTADTVPSDNRSSTTIDTPSDGKPVTKNTTHTVIFEKEFTLGSLQGLELDDEKGTIRMQQDSAKAPIDLYLSSSPYFYVTIKHFFPYQPLTTTGSVDNDQYAACRNLIDTSKVGNSSMGPSSIEPGQQYCITTTRDRVALITLKEMIDAGYDSLTSSVNFTVKLWN